MAKTLVGTAVYILNKFNCQLSSRDNIIIMFVMLFMKNYICGNLSIATLAAFLIEIIETLQQE